MFSIAVPAASAGTTTTTEKNPVRSVAAKPQQVKNQCPSARRGLAFYRLRHSDWLALRDVTYKPKIAQPFGCGHALWLANVWKVRSYKARVAYYRWRENRFVLHDFPYKEGNHAWHRAVEEVQRVFPGTESWLLSCSAAEGGHGRWVGYAGVGFSTWLRDSDTVGGPLQFRYSTFTGMYRRAADYAIAHGFRIPQFPDYTTAWRSALGQALAGGWARYTGNDNSHWSASWGNGC